MWNSLMKIIDIEERLIIDMDKFIYLMDWLFNGLLELYKFCIFKVLLCFLYFLCYGGEVGEM